MVVDAGGKSHGTIGGSLLEAGAIDEARRILATRRSKFVEFDLAGAGADSTGMICGGKAVALLDYIAATRENIDVFRGWCDATKVGASFYFLTCVKESSRGTIISGHSLLFPDGNTAGTPNLSPVQLETVKAAARGISVTTIVPVGGTRVVIDPVRKSKTLYCFGGGHVAVPTVHIAAMVGFCVVVIDDRAEFASAERFPEAERTCVVKNYAGAFEGLEIDGDSFVVIMTRGHQFDRVVLEQALKTRASYIGMISSLSKRNAVYKALLAKGVDKKALERVHSPIGIAIGSETPEEIAVSIVAQLIEQRARRLT